MYTNEYYDLAYDRDKNQINWKVKGFWPSVAVVPEVLAHWDTVLEQAKKPGFKVLADMSTMKASPQEIEKLHKQIQHKIMTSGVNKVATLMSASAVAAMAGKRVGRESGFAKVARNFSKATEAQAWLDE